MALHLVTAPDFNRHWELSQSKAAQLWNHSLVKWGFRATPRVEGVCLTCDTEGVVCAPQGQGALLCGQFTVDHG